MPANFRKFIVEGGEGGGGSLSSRVCRGVSAAIRRLALICMARVSKGEALSLPRGRCSKAPLRMLKGAGGKGDSKLPEGREEVTLTQ